MPLLLLSGEEDAELSVVQLAVTVRVKSRKSCINLRNMMVLSCARLALSCARLGLSCARLELSCAMLGLI